MPPSLVILVVYTAHMQFEKMTHFYTTLLDLIFIFYDIII